MEKAFLAQKVHVALYTVYTYELLQLIKGSANTHTKLHNYCILQLVIVRGIMQIAYLLHFVAVNNEKNYAN